mgnify:FL=1
MRRLVKSSLLSLFAAGFAGFGSPLESYSADLEIEPVSGICIENSPGISSYGQGNACNTGCQPVCADPFYYFDVDYLFWSRNSGSATSPIIGGPEALNYGGTGSDFESGVRLKAGAAFENFELQFSWSRIDNWNSTQSGQLVNGISFDSGIGTSFAGANFINGTTGFRSLFAAAEFNPGGGPDETLEDEGLGPVGIFADAAPTFNVQYRSDFNDYEFITKFAPITSRIKFGVGWRHADLDELMSASITGTFRAVDNAVGANGGLSHAALTAPNGGNLTLISGAADGFDDETGLLGGVGPDMLNMNERSSTTNALDGVQFSLDLLVMESERFLIDSVLKVGAYNNKSTGTFIETYSGIGNDNSDYGRTLTDSSNSVAFVGQVGLGTMYRFNDYVRFRFGWDVIFLSGVALAPEQTTLANTTYTINNDGSLVINGGHVGLEFVY